MIARIEPGMVHVNDALSRQERRPRRRLRRQALPEAEDEPRRGDADGVRGEDQPKLDLVA
ncbi:MAG: hypothetical protein WDA75_06480 [Candidatus Latescibacterota bacterium]|jgi:hypothetical protein